MKMMMDDGIPSRLHYERNVISNSRMSLLKKGFFPQGRPYPTFSTYSTTREEYTNQIKE